MVAIVHDKIDIGAIFKSVQDPAAGGIDIFIGTTRNHARGKNVLALEYEVYEPMALRMMEMIVEEITRKWKINKISIVHRVGKLHIGEESVVIAVSTAHRMEAFEACRYAIDTLKKNVPIWKKEFFENGEVWVEGETGSGLIGSHFP